MKTRVSTDETKAEKVLAYCPKCKEQSLHVHGMQGEDDHGCIEGGIEICEKCGYEDRWAYRC